MQYIHYNDSIFVVDGYKRGDSIKDNKYVRVSFMIAINSIVLTTIIK